MPQDQKWGELCKGFLCAASLMGLGHLRAGKWGERWGLTGTGPWDLGLRCGGLLELGLETLQVGFPAALL